MGNNPPGLFRERKLDRRQRKRERKQEKRKQEILKTSLPGSPPRNNGLSKRSAYDLDKMALLEYVDDQKQTMTDQEYLDIVNDLRDNLIHPFLQKRLDSCGRRARRRLLKPKSEVKEPKPEVPRGRLQSSVMYRPAFYVPWYD